MKTLHIWQVFAVAYPKEFCGSKHRYRLVIGHPALPMMDYYKGLKSSACSWMTHLSISTAIVLGTDMIRLANIPNLRALDVAIADDGMTSTVDGSTVERVFRTWSELAVAEQAFSFLRVLMIREQSDLRTTLVFSWLRLIRSLRILVFQDQHQWEDSVDNLTAEASSSGWTLDRSYLSFPGCTTPSEQSTELSHDRYNLDARLSSQPLDVLRIFSSETSASDPQTDDSGKTTAVPLPIIECRIGAPITLFGTIGQQLRPHETSILRRIGAPPPPPPAEDLQKLSRQGQDGKRKSACSVVAEGRGRLPKRRAVKTSAHSIEGLLSEFQGS